MKYTNIRTKLNKSPVPKFIGGGPLNFNGALGSAMDQAGMTAQDIQAELEYRKNAVKTTSIQAPEPIGLSGKKAINSFAQDISGVNFSENAKWRDSGLSERAATGMGIGAQVATKAFAVADELAMGDKNFDAQSQAIDSAVHGVSGALMKSGNPYAMAAGAALEGANFITKAGGQTVQGFDVEINSSGYGELGHMESTSQRDFGAAIGLGGLNMAKTERLLRNRNEQAQMALKAAGIASEQKFESEARMNSVENVMSNNNIALNGGISTDLIGG